MGPEPIPEALGIAGLTDLLPGSGELADRLPWQEVPRETAMLQSVQKLTDVASFPIAWIAGSAVLAAFAWLLATDRIPPVVVYLVQLFLSF